MSRVSCAFTAIVSPVSVALMALSIVAAPGCDRRPAAAATRPAAPPDRIRVLSLNIQRGRLGLDPIAALIASHSPDIVLLQEVLRSEHAPTARDQAQVLAESIGGYHVYSADRLGVHDSHKYGDPAILSRWKLLDAVLLRPGDGERPFALHARLDAPGRPLHIICVHAQGTFRLDLRHAVESSLERLKQADYLVRRVAGLDGDVLIGGDFNATDWMPEYAIMTDGWRDLSIVNGRRAASPTFPAVQPMLGIDHVFGVGSFAANDFQVLDTVVSDHRAIVVDLVKQ